VFGARGASTALSRATAIFAAVFMINSLLLTYVGTKISDAQPRTILDQATDGTPKTPAGAAKTPAPNTATVPAPAPTTPSPTSAPAPAAPEGTAPPK
jgi:preprotein translocase subunit SecG